MLKLARKIEEEEEKEGQQMPGKKLTFNLKKKNQTDPEENEK